MIVDLGQRIELRATSTDPTNPSGGDTIAHAYRDGDIWQIIATTESYLTCDKVAAIAALEAIAYPTPQTITTTCGRLWRTTEGEGETIQLRQHRCGLSASHPAAPSPCICTAWNCRQVREEPA